MVLAEADVFGDVGERRLRFALRGQVAERGFDPNVVLGIHDCLSMRARMASREEIYRRSDGQPTRFLRARRGERHRQSTGVQLLEV
jgi:hypothetical protein